MRKQSSNHDPNRMPLWEGLRLAGLFAGVGGIERGIHLAAQARGSACETRLLCEIDTFAIEVLKDRYLEPARAAGTPIEFQPDITRLDHLPSDVNLVTAGFPCQDLSQAGKTRGVDALQKNAKKARQAGLRSGLVGQVFRLLEDRIESGSPVEWVLIENVPFMLQLGRGKTLDLIVSEFEALGYSWAYRVVDAMCFGLPQRRERVYLLAHHRRGRDDDDLPCQVLFAEPGKKPLDRPWRPRKNSFGFYWTEGVRGLGRAIDAVPTLKGGSTVGIPSPPAVLLPNATVVTPDIVDAEELQGFPADWTKPAERVGRGGNRWKLVGNAVSVRAARWVGERLLDPRPFQPKHRNELPQGSPWPRAAWNSGSGRYEAESLVTAWPRKEPLQPIHEFLARPTRSGRELRLLSERATRGFLNRAESPECTLRFLDGFKEALHAHLDRVTGTILSV